MASFGKFNSVAASQWNGRYNLATDTVKAMLTNVAPVAANAVYADVSAGELATANGYTVGGATLTTTSSTQTAGLYKLILAAASPTWTATGALAAFRYVIIYDFTAAAKDLLGWWDLGSAITMANTDTFTLILDAVNGVIQDS
jgi:hypothetical protein